MTTIARTLSKTKIISLSFPEINWQKMLIAGIIFFATLMCLSLVSYVYLVNQLTKGSYVIKGYERELKKLSEENARLEMKFAEADFLGGVQERAGQMNFEKTKEVKYIQVLDSSLAKAK